MRASNSHSWLGFVLTLLIANPRVVAWDYELHRLIHQIALASLPTNFPVFVLTPDSRERIAFLSGESDRWRNTADTPLRHANGPEHYFDVDDLPDLGLPLDRLSPFREEFILQVHAGRTAHPERFPKIDPLKDPDHVKWFPGLLPWRITEDYARLKSAFSYLKTFEKDGDPTEVENAKANVVQFMGVMGHFVGDACQPLHTTHHFNGWTGENPKGYTTNKTFHAWIDGNFLKRVGYNSTSILQRVRPAKLAWDGLSINWKRTANWGPIRRLRQRDVNLLSVNCWKEARCWVTYGIQRGSKPDPMRFFKYIWPAANWNETHPPHRRDATEGWLDCGHPLPIQRASASNFEDGDLTQNLPHDARRFLVCKTQFPATSSINQLGVV
jgi:hypothetical protein